MYSLGIPFDAVHPPAGTVPLFNKEEYSFTTVVYEEHGTSAVEPSGLVTLIWISK
jgi:hypothetical protein